MKKALAIILTLMLLAVCLTGCSGQDFPVCLSLPQAAAIWRKK